MSTMNDGPIEQEARRGHALMHVGGDAYAEVSVFKGRAQASVRRWFKADDGVWYRTKNGLTLQVDVMQTLLSRAEELTTFVKAEAEHPWEGS